MRPILLKGHERSITYVNFNYDGDLLFTASKDAIPSVWNASNGERLGTYNGHQGAIWDMDCDRFSNRLLTASADATCKMWEAQTGVEIFSFTHRGPVRGVSWADGNNMFASISDPFMDNDAQISIYDVPQNIDPDSYSKIPRITIDLPKDDKIKATNVAWLNLNKALLVTFDDGRIRLYDPNTKQILKEVTTAHNKKVNRISFNKNKTLMLTSSADFTSKLFTLPDLQNLKSYVTDRPVNDACISPDKEHILLGGGQEAMSVTTTSGRVGKFETRFFHLVYEEEFGIVKGHFGPINALACNPDGKSYASGAEDGYIRLHFYDPDYLKMKDPVPEEEAE